jgi:hypothetical protein
MPFETPFPPAVFAGTITAAAHEHGGEPPQTIIRTNQSWAVDVSWENTGSATGMVTGIYDLHLLLESIGPGVDLDLIDPNDHIIPLTPGPSPVRYGPRHVFVAANRVPAGLYKLAVILRYHEPSPGNPPGPIAAYQEISSVLQFYDP